MTDTHWLKQNKPLRLDANEEVFDSQRRLFHRERYEFARPFVQGRDVIDVACGTGYGSAILAETACRVTGIDLSRDAVEYACGRYGRDKVRFATGFAERTGLPDGSADVVVSFETLEHLICPEKGLEEYRRLLRPEGVLVASVPNRWGYTKHHFVDFSYDLLKDLIDRSFESASYFYQNSGRKRRFKPVGIGRLTADLQDSCECILVVATHPRSAPSDEAERTASLIEAIYVRSFERHREFLRYDEFFRRIRAQRLTALVKSLLPAGARSWRS